MGDKTTEWVTKSVRIGRTEAVRTWRSVTRNRRQLLLRVVLRIPLISMLTAISVVFGLLVRNDPPRTVSTRLRLVVVLCWVFFAFIFAVRAFGKTHRVDRIDLLLTTVPPRVVVGGLLIAEFVRVGTSILVPLFLMAVGFSYGSGDIVTLFTMVSGGLLAIVSALFVGYAAGICGAIFVTRSEIVARHRTGISVLLLAIMVPTALALQLFGHAGARSLDGLTPVVRYVPIGWYADIVFSGTPLAVSTGHVVGGVVGTFVLVPLLTFSIEQLATIHWYGERIQPPSETKRDDERVDPDFDALSAALGAVALLFPAGISYPTERVSKKTLLRALRRPSKLSHLALPIGITAVMVATIPHETLRNELPVITALMGSWTAGAAFTLNPLGDEGPMLPLTLSSSLTGEQFVSGLLLPGVLIGVPVETLLTLIACVSDGWRLLPTIEMGVVGVLLGLTAVVFAAWIGISAPRFDGVTVSQRRGLGTPSTTALVAYSGFVIGVSYTVLLLLRTPSTARAITTFGPLSGGVPLQWFRVAGYASLLSISTGGNLIACRNAVKHFRHSSLN
ncbi:hypothetical protein A4G99_10980 [Haladaptatus sp. R4]|uniref:hypothetical protein n=1 Tax=Haladaptatus sp. R4 TaxID=1679489 RepID=UPI0007B4E228|nr:hypothetical protein [Haladaptatus sp. R4]KZN24838.1 hypothetical protein A4G99_10980 [Haladaptatus sp. R4]